MVARLTPLKDEPSSDALITSDHGFTKPYIKYS
jgi:hypothetical protein